MTVRAWVTAARSSPNEEYLQLIAPSAAYDGLEIPPDPLVVSGAERPRPNSRGAAPAHLALGALMCAILAGCGGAGPAAPGPFTVGTPPGTAAATRAVAGVGAAQLPGQPGVVTLARVRAPDDRSQVVMLTGLDRTSGTRQLLCLAETRHP